MSEVIMNSLAELIVSVLFLIISTILVPAVAAWLRSKTESEILKSVISDIEQTVKTSVNFVEQTVVGQYKSDGKWDSDAQKHALEMATAEVLHNLAMSTHNYLLSEGVDEEEVVHRYIESYIQSKK